MTKGRLRGFYFPDYDGGCIVNLLSSVIRAMDGHSPHRQLGGLPARQLADAKKIVYLVIDGLGVSQLQRALKQGVGKGFLGAHPFMQISSVFPATTASAVTTFASGASPVEHGVLSWYLNLHDLGVVSTILFAHTRTGMPMVPEDFDLHAYLNVPSYLDTVPVRKELLSYGHIPKSRYSQTGTAWQRRHSYKTLRGMERQIVSFARRRGRALAYAYWPGYDSLCHEVGCSHPQAVRHLKDIDRSLGRLVAKLAGTGTTLLVLADHGLVDAPSSCQVDLAQIPGFYDCLATLPSGDARQVSCFVRPSKEKAFVALVREHLADACICIPGSELLKWGAFGPGKAHPSLASRVGDYVLLARDAYAFTSTLPGRETSFNVGNHGGMSREEVLVPLYVVAP